MTISSPSLAREPGQEAPTGVRYRVLGMLCLLSFILYLDRICISQAVGSIQDELDISNEMMGYVLGAFTLAYGLFEIPTGHWGDRYGSRGVLTRIVLWWSLFTVLTGAATGFVMMVIVRFLFGAGEAGAFPNAARVVARWFPAEARGAAQGVVITSALVGGAASPIITGYLIDNLGWRWSFATLGIPGVIWSIAFYLWFRDDPAEHPAVNQRERDYIQTGGARPTLAAHHTAVPWKIVLRSANVWLLGGIASCASFTTYLFFMWYPTYLQRARGATPETASWLSGAVLAAGACASVFGGRISDWLMNRTGNRRWTRRLIGCGALGSAGLGMVLSMFGDSIELAVACAIWAALCIHFQLTCWWGAVTEISGPHLGALFGLMNSLGVPGAVASPLFLGWFVDYLGRQGYHGRAQWDSAFYVYGGLLLVGAVCWLFVDPAKSAVEPAPLAA